MATTINATEIQWQDFPLQFRSGNSTSPIAGLRSSTYFTGDGKWVVEGATAVVTQATQGAQVITPQRNTQRDETISQLTTAFSLGCPLQVRAPREIKFHNRSGNMAGTFSGQLQRFTRDSRRRTNTGITIPGATTGDWFNIAYTLDNGLAVRKVHTLGPVSGNDRTFWPAIPQQTNTASASELYGDGTVFEMFITDLNIEPIPGNLDYLAITVNMEEFL